VKITITPKPTAEEEVQYPLFMKYVGSDRDSRGTVMAFNTYTSGILIKGFGYYKESTHIDVYSGLLPHTDRSNWKPYNGTITIEVP
jgi:hypothetical protein